MGLASQGSGASDSLRAAAAGGYGAASATSGSSNPNNVGLPTPPTPSSAKPPSSSTSNNAPSSSAGPQAQTLFDPAADPVYQQVQAQMAAANSQAQSLALSQEEQELLNLGDPALAQAMLGANDPMISAIGNNPESQYAQLARQYQQQLQQFNETIDPSLVDSGYRVLQDTNMAQALQDARAAAASQAQSQIQQYMDQSAATQAGDANTLSQALADAYNRYVQQYLNNPPASPSTPSAPAPKAHKGSAKKIAHKSKKGHK